MSFKARVLPYWRQWTKTAAAAAQAITDIANLWGYWRSDTGVNGKLAVDLIHSYGTATDYLENFSVNVTVSSGVISCHVVCEAEDWNNIAAGQMIFDLRSADNSNVVQLFTNSNGVGVFAQLGGTAKRAYTAFSPTDNQYTFFTVIVKEGDVNGLKLYVDTDEKAYTINDDRDTTGLTFDGALTDLRIGTNRTYVEPLVGSVDQFVVVNGYDLTSELNTFYNSGSGIKYGDLAGTESYYSSIAAWYDFDIVGATAATVGKDSHTGGLNLTPTSITSSNAVAGVVVGQVINQENVFSWTDLSGNSNDLEQSTVANQPLYDENKGLKFTGGDNLITSGNAGIATDFTVFWVGQFTDITEATALLKTSADLISKDTSGKIKNDFATTPNASTTALVNDTNKIFAVRLEDGVAGDYWFNGTQGDSITDTTNNTTDAVLRLINTTLTGSAFVDSVVVYQRSLTDAEMADVFTDLNNRFSVY